MGLLTKGDIIAAQDLKSEDVEVPEWGGTVRVQEMSGFARDQYDASLIAYREAIAKGEPVPSVRSALCAAAIVDVDGNLVFTTKADIEALGKKNAAGLNRVFDAAARLNRMGEAEDTQKNSSPSHDAGSTSA